MIIDELFGLFDSLLSPVKTQSVEPVLSFCCDDDDSVHLSAWPGNAEAIECWCCWLSLNAVLLLNCCRDGDCDFGSFGVFGGTPISELCRTNKLLPSVTISADKLDTWLDFGTYNTYTHIHTR